MKKMPREHPPRSFTGLYLVLLILLLIFSLVQGWQQSSQAHFDTPDPNSITRVVSAATSAPSPTPLPVERYREERAQSQAHVETLLSALSQSAADDDVRSLAENALLQYTQDARHTELVESALQGLGLHDAVCAVQSGLITIFLPQPIDDATSQMIFSLVREWTGADDDHIRLLQGI